MFYFPASMISLLWTGSDDDKEFLMSEIKLEQCNTYLYQACFLSYRVRIFPPLANSKALTRSSDTGHRVTQGVHLHWIQREMQDFPSEKNNVFSPHLPERTCYQASCLSGRKLSSSLLEIDAYPVTITIWLYTVLSA